MRKYFFRFLFSLISGGICFSLTFDLKLSIITAIITLFLFWYFDPERVFIRVFFIAFGNLTITNHFSLYFYSEFTNNKLAGVIGEESWYYTIVIGIISFLALILHFRMIRKEKDINHSVSSKNKISFKNQGDAFYSEQNINIKK